LTANLANYLTLAGLSSNVTTVTANNTLFVGTVPAANVVSNAQLSSNLANYATLAGLSANVATLTANNTAFVGLTTAANVVSNTQLQSNLANYATLSGLSANVAKLDANTSLFSNNATNLGGQAAAYYTNASNLGTGTLPTGRLTGSYTGITAVGTLTGIAVTGNSNFDSGVLFVDGTNNRVGIGNTAPDVALRIAANDAIAVPSGNTAERPTGSVGMFRYNVDTGSFEGYANGSWGNIAGGSTGGGYYKGNLGTFGNTDNKGNLYRINSNTQSNNITVAAGENALTVGPMVISTGYNLTIEEGGRAVII
jgi:hypothetical protein